MLLSGARFAAVSFVLCLLLGPTNIVPAASSFPPVGGQVPALRVQSDLVVLHVAVQDRESRFVPGLSANQLKVFEDGAPQTIQFFSHEDQPATIGLVIDNSGSMANKRDDVIAASLAFIGASHPGNEVFITNFNEQVWSGLPLDTPFTGDRGALTNALLGIGARGRTALYDAVSRALDLVNAGTNNRHVLVVISDGRDNASGTRLDDLRQRIQEGDAVIYTLGLFDESSDDSNPKVLKQLAALTGGECFLPGNARTASHVLERIARDIRNTYTIGYESTNLKRDGKFRRIRVAMDSSIHQRITVRARAGYVVPRDPALDAPPRRP